MTKVVVVDRFSLLQTIFGWLLDVFDRWSLFRARFSAKTGWAGYEVVVVDR